LCYLNRIVTESPVKLRNREYFFGIFFYSKPLFKLEEKLSLDALNEINELFTEYDTDGSGSLELEEFKNVVKRALKIEGRVC
jgi:hypothetical protein